MKKKHSCFDDMKCFLKESYLSNSYFKWLDITASPTVPWSHESSSGFLSNICSLKVVMIDCDGHTKSFI